MSSDETQVVADTQDTEDKKVTEYAMCVLKTQISDSILNALDYLTGEDFLSTKDETEGPSSR